MNLSLSERIARHDSHDFYGILSRFPRQAEEGLAIGARADIASIDAGRIRAILVAGMGGSAIGGDILRAYLLDRCRIPLFVNRSYTLPAFAGEDTLVIASSYSGDTEETLSAYEEARRRGAQILVISSGGELTRRASEKGHALIAIPGGLAPRCALGYGFFPLFRALIRLGIAAPHDAELEETLRVLQARAARFADISGGENEAVAIASKIGESIPVIYSALGPLDAVNLRWRCQLEENAKMLSWGNVFPELNHNEIVGWERFPDLLGRLALVLLRDREDPPRLVRRIDVTRSILQPLAGGIVEASDDANSLLARIFGLICLGDWVSFYAAIQHGIDPFPIGKIDALKSALRSTAGLPR